MIKNLFKKEETTKVTVNNGRSTWVEERYEMGTAPFEKDPNIIVRRIGLKIKCRRKLRRMRDVHEVYTTKYPEGVMLRIHAGSPIGPDREEKEWVKYIDADKINEEIASVPIDFTYSWIRKNGFVTMHELIDGQPRRKMTKEEHEAAVQARLKRQDDLMREFHEYCTNPTKD